MPEDLYEKLTYVTAKENRSIAQETIVLLRKALNLQEERKFRRVRLLEEIKSNKIKNADNFPNPANLIREDRDR